MTHDGSLVIQVVMTVRNRQALTTRAIETARASAVTVGAALRWVVLDDGSTDGTNLVLDDLLDESDVVLHGDGSCYWAGGMRRAMSVASGWHKPFSHLLMLNDDAALYPSAISSLLSAASTGPLTIAVGTVVEPGTTRRTYGGARRCSRWRRLTFVPVEQAAFEPVDVMNANAVLMTAAAFRRLGPLRKPYTHGLADFDYALYAKRRGVRVILAAEIVGECSLNMSTAEWFNPKRPLVERWRLFVSPKGLPPIEWAVYCLRHGSLLGPIYALSPLLRVVAPSLKRRNLM